MQPSDDDLIGVADQAHVASCRAQNELFGAIRELERREIWRGTGAYSMAHWVALRYGISSWKAERWVTSARALEGLPATTEALDRGELGVDKVVELTRFADFETEDGLVTWAQRVSPAVIRHRAELTARQEVDETRTVQAGRFLDWRHIDDGRRLSLHGELPTADGEIIARTLDQIVDELPVMPGEDHAHATNARRADALIALCSSGSNDEWTAASLVIHVDVDTLEGGHSNAEIDDGPVIPAPTARRLACNAKIQALLEDPVGEPLRLGRTSREPSTPMLRALRHRDGGCTFPGCGSRRFTHAHHVRWWSENGSTDLENLVLVCSFHHRLVHEYGWTIQRARGGEVNWFWPDGQRHRAGPVPSVAQPSPAIA